MYARNEQGFCSHMRSFIPHITESSHEHFLHKHQEPKRPWLCVEEDAGALKQLEILISGYIADCQWYIHGFSTIQIEV
jgi:hypothetical protein